MIRTAIQDNIYLVILDRPDQRNALTPEMSDALVAAIKSCPASARTLLLCGNGPVFCAGFDLPLCNQHPDGSVLRHLLKSLSAAITSLRNLHCPVVAAAQGGAIAGGCALLTAADHVVADARAKFGYPVHRLGLSPAVSLPTLAQAIGSGALRSLAFDSQLIDGHRALELSLIHTLVETAPEVRPCALQVAMQFGYKPPHAMTATRNWVAKVAHLGESTSLAALSASLSTAGSAEQIEMLELLLRTRQKP